jgi:dTDP-4-amino-4,6-dideoxygalactose transaminase
MDQWHRARRENTSAIISCCDLFPELSRTPRPLEHIEHAWYKRIVFLRPEGLSQGWTRSRMIEGINSRGVPCFQGDCPEVYLEKVFDRTGFRPKDLLPVAKELG